MVVKLCAVPVRFRFDDVEAETCEPGHVTERLAEAHRIGIQKMLIAQPLHRFDLIPGD